MVTVLKRPVPEITTLSPVSQAPVSVTPVCAENPEAGDVIVTTGASVSRTHEPETDVVLLAKSVCVKV